VKAVEEVIDIKHAGYPAWSPDGESIAFILNDPRTGPQVAVHSLQSRSTRVITEKQVSAERLSWSADSQNLLIVRPNDSGGSDISVLNTIGTGGEKIIATGSWINRSASFSPNGQWVAYLSGERGSLDVWVVPSDGGEPRQVTSNTNPLDESRWAPRWAPDGKWIAYVSSRSGERNNDDLWISSFEGDVHRQLTVGILVNSNPAWSPDGRWLAVVGNTETERWYGDDADIWRVDAHEGPTVRLTPAGGHSRKLEGAGITWTPGGEEILAIEFRNGNQHIASIPGDGRVRTRVTNLSGQMTDMAVSPDGKRLAVIHESPVSPPNLYTMPLTGGPLNAITTFRAPDEETILAPTRVPYRSFDGLYCDAYLYLPPHFDDSRMYPGLVQVHGGGTNAYGNGWHPLEQWLSHQGFVVVAIEYRGSSGYGREFADLSYADWGGGQTHDATAAGRWLLDQPYISSIGIYGGSYGGFMTLHSIVAEPDLFSAAVDMYGKTNAFTGQEQADRVGRLFSSRDYWGRYAHEIPNAMERLSTVHKLDRIKTPLLIMHGDKDTRVPPVESEQVAEQLAKSDVPYDYVVYPGEGHGFRKWEHRIDHYGRILEWFNKYLREAD